MTDIPAEKIVSHLVNIAREISRREQDREIHLRSTHGRFNLFTTLLGAHDEVRLHTRFLSHLLDPAGEHDCGGLFLEHFLNVSGLSESLKAGQCIKVTKEFYTGGLGNIDIYMEFKDATVVIENKIYAGDQERQLERYAEYAERTKKTWHLFYLTLHGGAPSVGSRGKLSDDKIKIISYKEHILPWLELCLQNTYSYININQALQQYRNVINQLLGKTLEVHDMDMIKEQLLKSAEIMENSDQIVLALQEIKRDREREIQQDFLKELGDEIDFWIWYWDNGKTTVFKFASPKWGSKKTTDLTITVSKEGRYGLRVYDEECGRLWNAVESTNCGGRWTPESNFFCREIASNLDMQDALIELKKIISRLD